MNTPHKHAELIKAWADGAVIQFLTPDGSWADTASNNPAWAENGQYRVKPELKDPGVVCRDAFYRAVYLEYEHKPMKSKEWTAAAKAVIDAYKAGELKDF